MTTPTPQAVKAAQAVCEYFREFYPDPEELEFIAAIIEREMGGYLPLPLPPQ